MPIRIRYDAHLDPDLDPDPTLSFRHGENSEFFFTF
jgi:hypothetical protein